MPAKEEKIAKVCNFFDGEEFFRRFASLLVRVVSRVSPREGGLKYFFEENSIPGGCNLKSWKFYKRRGFKC